MSSIELFVKSVSQIISSTKTKFIKPANVILKFGEPIRYDIEKKPSKERINNVRDEIMSKIQSLYNEIS